MNSQAIQALVDAALDARKNAYAPYSQFAVGAALLTADDSIFTGCNVENASYGLAICAERSAICTAVGQGHKKFKAIAIAASPFATPCGACRQFIVEFGTDIEVICVDAENVTEQKSWKISELLPESFGFDKQ